MAEKIEMLIIAPNAPPKNSAESIQVGRILQALDAHASGTYWLTPASAGWSQTDASLALSLQHFSARELRLPLHRYTARLLRSRFGKPLHVIDSESWILLKKGKILRNLTQKPDVMYSRSYPLSAALLARELKEVLQIPWVMHLSDPWAEQRDKAPNAKEELLEKECFDAADAVALTTHGQAEHYRHKYPHWAEKIFVSPNMMPDAVEEPPSTQAKSNGALRLTFTGALYGMLSPRPLTEAIAQLKQKDIRLAEKLQIDFYGNLLPDYAAMLAEHPDIIHYHGAVPYARAVQAQMEADIALSIEPPSEKPLDKSCLVSKVMNYLACGKPIFAITCNGSETDLLCREGYGWSVPPWDSAEIAARLKRLLENPAEIADYPAKAPPERFLPSVVAQELLSRIQRLIGQG